MRGTRVTTNPDADDVAPDTGAAVPPFHVVGVGASAGGLDIPQEVNIAVPALLDIGQSVVRAIEASAVVALFVTAIRGMPRAERFADMTAILALFFITLDSNTKPTEAPMMLLSSITGALLAWFIVRFVMRENLLAYPLAAALALLLGSAATLLQNHRSDLMVNGVVYSVTQGAALGR